MPINMRRVTKAGDKALHDIRRAAIVTVVKARRRNVPVDLAQEAQRLLSGHPDCGLSLEEIEELIVRIASLDQWAVTLIQDHEKRA